MNFNEVLDQLESGALRSATKINEKWQANVEIKRAILEAFKAGKLTEMNGFVDKDTYPVQKFSVDKGVRLVPGGTAIRRGCHLAKGVIVMPPSYVNVGAFVDSGTMIDSHVLVGSCAQIGKNVHLSTGVQIGGVLEPINANPVVIEDHCFLGADAVVVEGIIVKEGAVIAPGVILSRGVKIFDCVNECEIKDFIIPKNAVVVSGTRPLNDKSTWGIKQGLQVYCALIIKYRDHKSDASLTLEEALR